MKNLILLFVALISAGSIFAHNEPTNLVNGISTKLVYPQDAIKNKEEGTVYISFELDENYNVVNAKIELGVSASLNNAALTFLKNLSYEDLINLQVNKEERSVLPIKFHLL